MSYIGRITLELASVVLELIFIPLIKHKTLRNWILCQEDKKSFGFSRTIPSTCQATPLNFRFTLGKKFAWATKVTLCTVSLNT